MASEFIKLLDGATATTNLANKSSATTLPTSGYRDLSGRNVRAVRLRFGGTGAANKDFAYQIFIWKKRGDLTTAATATIYDPEEVARGVATLGAKTYVDGGATHYEADTITQTLTARPSAFVFSPADDRTAWILVDCPAAIGIQAVVDANGGADMGAHAATTCDVFMQELGEGEAALPFELINLMNTKLGAYTGPVDGTAADDNAKAHLDIVNGKLGAFDRAGDGAIDDTILAELKAIVGRQYSRDAANFIGLYASMTEETWNTDAKHKILTVSGPVHVRMLVYCLEDITDAAGASRFVGVGPTGDTDKYLNTGGGLEGPHIDAGEFIPVTGGADVPVKGDVTSNLVADFCTSESIFYEIDAAAFTGGSLMFYIWYELLDNISTATVGDGSAV